MNKTKNHTFYILIDFREKKEKNMDQILKKSLEKIGIEITDEQKEQFDTYHKLLEEWNKVMNLTGITEYEEVVEKH